MSNSNPIIDIPLLILAERQSYEQDLERLLKSGIEIRKTAEREAALQEKERLSIKSEWEKYLYINLPEGDRVNRGGIQRITGRKLLQLIDWQLFEVLLVHLLKSQGWNAKTTSGGSDGGIDVEGSKGTRKLFLQAKHYRGGGNVGRPDLQRLMGVAQSKGATDAILASSSGFTRQALSERVSNLPYSLELWDGKKIESLINRLESNEYEDMIEPMKNSIRRNIR